MVSIITVNYNGWRDTCDLVRSFKEHETYSYEFLVVDNASSGEDVERISALCPDVKLICNSTNLGFAGGNNRGLAYAKGEYVFFLNNDMLVEEPILEKLVTRLRNETIGGVSPTVRYLTNKENIQYFGCRRLKPLTLKFQTEVFDCNCPAKCIEACETEVLYGGAMMVRRDVIEQVWKMPEVFFLFAEEFDWSYQITEAGYKLWYEAEVVVYHKGGATIGYGSPNRAYYMSRARLLFTRRRSKWAIRLLSCTYLVCVSMPKNVIVALRKKNWMVAIALIRGTWHGLIDKKK